MFNNQDIFAQMLDSIDLKTEALLLKEKIKDAIVGKYMTEELNKLQGNSDVLEIIQAKNRAQAKADIVSEIIVSNRNAQLLFQELNGFNKHFEHFKNELCLN
jgi:hypothetical protein